MFKEMMDTIGFVTQADPEVGAAMEAELKRQRGNIELIASENIVSPAVMAAIGSVLTNKYAEFGRAGQSGRLFCAAERGRYRPGHGSFQRRPPHPRQPCEHERQEL